MSLIYRPIIMNDVACVVNLAIDTFGNDEASHLNQWLSSSTIYTADGLNSVMYGAFSGTELVGIGSAMENPACEHIVSLGWLAVRPEFRCKGIGVELVRLRAKWAHDHRPNADVDRILELSCYESMEPWHEKNGFIVTMRHRPGISCVMQASSVSVMARLNMA